MLGISVYVEALGTEASTAARAETLLDHLADRYGCYLGAILVDAAPLRSEADFL